VSRGPELTIAFLSVVNIAYGMSSVSAGSDIQNLVPGSCGAVRGIAYQ
jgi:hypothetical protein